MTASGIRFYSQMIQHQDQAALLLYEAWKRGEVDPADLPELLDYAWTRSNNDSPEDRLGQAAWIGLFRLAGRFVVPTNYSGPTGPTTVWRGASRDRRDRMSWTITKSVAVDFARRHGRYVEGCLFLATVDLEGYLAFTDTKHEQEVVVDPAFLRNVQRVA